MTRRLVVLMAALALALPVLAACDSGGSGEGAGAKPPAAATLPQPLPTFALAGFNGGPSVDLASLRGPMVINLWAVWCEACREEMPVLEKFSAQARGKVEVIGINTLETQPDEAPGLIADTGVTYDLYSDPRSDLTNIGPFPAIRGLPFLALVDEQGEVVFREFSKITSVDELAALVEEHLGVRV